MFFQCINTKACIRDSGYDFLVPRIDTTGKRKLFPVVLWERLVIPCISRIKYEQELQIVPSHFQVVFMRRGHLFQLDIQASH